MTKEDARRARLRIEIISKLPDLNADETEVLTVILRRLWLGRGLYGPLGIATDSRDWNNEALEEHLDGLVYLACDAIRRRRSAKRPSLLRQAARWLGRLWRWIRWRP